MTKIRTLGFGAEHYVADVLREKGHEVEFSDYEYDMKKDLMVDGIYTEVKIQTLYYYTRIHRNDEPFKSFTIYVTESNGKINHNQLNKVVHVPKLLILQRPSERFNETTMKLWEAPPVGKRYFQLTRNPRSDSIIAVFPLNSFKLIDERKNDEFYNFSQLNNTSRY